MPLNPQQASMAVLIESLQALGAFRDNLVVVGGAVPELLFPGRGHIGTLDVDLAVAPTALGPNVYETLLQRLLSAGYTHQTAPNRFLRRFEGLAEPIKLDLIAGQYQTGEKSVSIQVNELSISTLRGLDLAFDSFETVEITGTMPGGAFNSVRARVVRPEAFILTKAFALDERLKPKDAYDIAFVLENFQPSLEVLSESLRPLLKNGLAREGCEILKTKFRTMDSIGPNWAAKVYQESGGDHKQARRAAFENAQALFACI